LCLLSELARAMNEFAVLVPDETTRREYVRMFKWVVAFATWRFTPTAEEKLANEKHKKLVAAANKNEETARQLRETLPAEDKTPAKTAGSSQKAGAGAGSSQLTTPQKQTKSQDAFNIPGNAALGSSTQSINNSPRGSPRIPMSARNTADVPLPARYSRPSGLSASHSSGYSFGSSAREVTSSSSPKKHPHGHKQTATSSGAAAGSSSTPPTMFSQRQSKSEVAAYIARKHAQRVMCALIYNSP
jgi:hypothetical protein